VFVCIIFVKVSAEAQGIFSVLHRKFLCCPLKSVCFDWAISYSTLAMIDKPRFNPLSKGFIWTINYIDFWP